MSSIKNWYTSFMRLVVKWFLLIITILFLGIILVTFAYYHFYMQMNPKTRAAAESAFRSGVTIEDEQNDFVMMGTNKEEPNENNPSPYRLSYLDIKSLQLGADEKYLYYKVTFQEMIPQSGTKVGDDQILDPGMKLNLVDDQNQDYAILDLGYSYLPLGLYNIGTYYYYGPTGVVWPEENRFLHQDYDSKIFGGPGYEYVMGAFPLKKLGLGIKQEVNLTLSIEARSKKYSHAAVDNLGGEDKMPGIITWKIGGKQFIIDNQSRSQGY